MAVEARNQIPIMDSPELDGFIAAYRVMGQTLHRIAGLPDLPQGVREALSEAHIAFPEAACWCKAGIIHVSAFKDVNRPS